MAGAWGICDRCGFKFRHSALKKEWTGLLVCRKDWDPRPPETKPFQVKPEGVPIRDARPEPEPIYRDPAENGWDDL